MADLIDILEENGAIVRFVSSKKGFRWYIHVLQVFGAPLQSANDMESCAC